VPVRPPIAGLDELGVDDGVHLLHSMGDTFALTKTLDALPAPSSALIIGAGYVGLEMAQGLTARGIRVTQVEMLPEVLPTVDPELGELIHAELEKHGVEAERRGCASTAPVAHGSPGAEVSSCAVVARHWSAQLASAW